MNPIGRWALPGLLAMGVAACNSGVAQTPAGDLAERSAPAMEVTSNGSARALSADFRAAASVVMPAVVRVDVTQQAPAVATNRRMPANPFGLPFDMPQQPESGLPRAGTGSGFIYDASGLVLTNRHVVDGADRVVVRLSDGREFNATTVGADANTDVAVLRLDVPDGGDLPVLALADADDIGVGEWVLAVGSPMGLDFSVTAGIVSAKGRSIGILARDGGAPLEAFIQTDAAINPGNSGGPLVDLDGRVVGINTAIQSSTGVFAGYGFAVPIGVARKVAQDLVQFGEVRRPRLGVQVTDANAADAKVFSLPSVSGAMIRSVQEGTVAAKAGLRMGDVVVALDGRPIVDASGLTTALASRKPGDEVELGVIRYGERMTLAVRLEQFSTDNERARTRAAARAPDLLGFDAAAIDGRLARELGERAGDGLVITSVEPAGSAARAGLRPGTVIRSINGTDVRTRADLDRVRSTIDAGDAVSLVVSTADGEVMINYLAR
jgi:serine protease Do